ncbi:hypothetical protein GQ457_04G024340 [Hibiscus cannabinus]
MVASFVMVAILPRLPFILPWCLLSTKAPKGARLDSMGFRRVVTLSSLPTSFSSLAHLKANDMLMHVMQDTFKAKHVMNEISNIDMQNIGYIMMCKDHIKGIETSLLHGMDDVVVTDDDCRVELSGPYLSITFFEKVHDMIYESMRCIIIVRLLGRLIGQFQVVDLDNDYFLVKFESEYDYVNVLIEGPWTIYVYVPWMISKPRRQSAHKDPIQSNTIGAANGKVKGLRFSSLENLHEEYAIENNGLSNQQLIDNVGTCTSGKNGPQQSKDNVTSEELNNKRVGNV